jgi:hypothetical protein
MKCEHCGHDVPEGPYCTRCGAPRQTGSEGGNPKTRHESYAAQPGEHVLHPNVFSTLLPHLGRQKLLDFRFAMLIGVAAFFILVIIGLITSAILLAAFLVPVIYLMYLYEAQVYRDEPVRVLGLTFGGGIVLGLIVTLIADNLVNPFGLQTVAGNVDVGTLLILGLVFPVISEIVKPLPTLPLRFRPQFAETVDGLVFGVAAGLGFGLAATIVDFWSVFHELPFRTDPANWIYPVTSVGIHRPLLQGSATGLIVAAIWRMGRGRMGGREIGAIALAMLAHVGFILGSQGLANNGFSQLIVLAWQTLMVAPLLVAIRYLLHHSLLEEAEHMGYRPMVCPNCHHAIVASSFCPQCGKALAASPGQSRGEGATAAVNDAPPATEGI